MKTRNWGVLTGLLAFAALAPTVTAQTVRGRFFLPGGVTPRMEIRFYLSGGDGSVNTYEFSDSHGRFILERLSNRIDYTITVDSDGLTYGTTTYTFSPAYESSITIYLKPLPGKSVARQATISASSGYKPLPAAADAYSAAKKALEIGNTSQAEKLLRKAIQADRQFADPFNDLAALLMQQRHYAEAEPLLRHALEADPKHVQANLNLGITLYRLSRYAESVPPLREASRLDERLSAPHLFLGGSLVELDQFEEAENQLNLAATMPGVDEAGLNLFRGKLYARTGRYAKAIEALQAYLERAPNAHNAPEVRALIGKIKNELGARN